MAYNIKYKFRFESVNGTVYEVQLEEDGYSGSVIERPLGAAPVLRMQDGDSIRAVSCDLVLECQSDGEYVDLYTTDPFHYKVGIYRKNGSSLYHIWTGFVATEIYSEPDIAPPYDVRITATDGLGTLKEYTFEPVGSHTIRWHICELLKKTGDSTPTLLTASELCAAEDTVQNFMDKKQIDLDFLAGKTCYDVLNSLLSTFRWVLTRRTGSWLIVREVDAYIDSSGTLRVYQSIGSASTLATTLTSLNVGKTVGQMGVAQMWPIGFLTRRIVPAKRSVAVRAPFYFKNGYPKVSDDGWNVSGYSGYEQNAYFVSNGGYYNLGATNTATMDAMCGKLWQTKSILNFKTDFKVTVRVSKNNSVSSQYPQGVSWLAIHAEWNGTNEHIYYTSEDGWDANASSVGPHTDVTTTNPDHLAASTQEVSIVIPAPLVSTNGDLTIRIDGRLVEVYEITVEPSMFAGYEDILSVDNGARGTAPNLELCVCRLFESGFEHIDFYRALIWEHIVYTYATVDRPVYEFDDYLHRGYDFLSITALAYARENMAARIEVSGKLNNVYDSNCPMPPMFVKSHGIWALMKSYSWNMKEEEVDFVAVTLPSGTMTVESETIKGIPND